MKKMGVVLLVMILAGCATTMPNMADLDITVARQQPATYPASLKVTLIGRDVRTKPAVIVYQLAGEPAVSLVSRLPIRELVQEGLARGLKQQGLNLVDQSDIAVVVKVKELLARVTKPGMLYSAVVRTRLRLVVGNGGSTLTLDFNREATKESLTRPEVLDLELMINNQLSDIVNKILSDDRVKQAIEGRG